MKKRNDKPIKDEFKGVNLDELLSMQRVLYETMAVNSGLYRRMQIQINELRLANCPHNVLSKKESHYECQYCKKKMDIDISFAKVGEEER